MRQATGRVTCDSMATPAPVKIGIDKLLAGNVSPNLIKDKVLVIGYDRKDSPSITVNGTQVPIHTMFYRQVVCLSHLIGDAG